MNIGSLEHLRHSTVFAIDPGTTESAYCIWNGKQIVAKEKLPNEEILLAIAGASLGPERMSWTIEMIGHYGTGMPAGSEVFETCVWIGRFYAACPPSDGPPALVKRGKVKLHLCGSARAKDGNVRQALIDRFGPPGTKASPGLTYGVSGDVWQAFALAVYAYDTIHKETE